MKFLLELVTCCGVCSSEARRPADETRLLVAEEPPRRRVGRRRGRNRAGSRDWEPSLCSISEENAPQVEKRSNLERPTRGWRSRLKRKMASAPPRRDRASFSLDHRDFRRDPFASLTPAFTPAPFMF